MPRSKKPTTKQPSAKTGWDVAAEIGAAIAQVVMAAINAGNVPLVEQLTKTAGLPEADQLRAKDAALKAKQRAKAGA